MIHVIDVGCWQAEMYGHMVVGWKRSRGKRRSAIELNFGRLYVTFTASRLVTITYAKCRQEKDDFEFLKITFPPTFLCHHFDSDELPRSRTNKSSHTRYLNSIQIVVLYIIDIFVRAMSYIAHRNLGEFVRYIRNGITLPCHIRFSFMINLYICT